MEGTNERMRQQRHVVSSAHTQDETPREGGLAVRTRASFHTTNLYSLPLPTPMSHRCVNVWCREVGVRGDDALGNGDGNAAVVRYSVLGIHVGNPSIVYPSECCYRLRGMELTRFGA